MIRKLSPAQRRVLESLPNEFERFRPRRGIPHMLGNPTVHVLIHRGWIEVATVEKYVRKMENAGGEVDAFDYALRVVIYRAMIAAAEDGR